jgi:arsenite-transporting ATPase
VRMSPLGLETRYLFFTGKGGVGKTTLACATALALADAGRRVLLVSTDPASNLGEMLGLELGATPREISGASGLQAIDIDPEQAAEDYRQRVIAPYLGTVDAAEIGRIRESLSGACTVEIAAFDRFAGLLAGDDAAFDHVVFDTAPTGHTLRLLDLPRAWSDFLADNTRGASCLGPHSALTTRRDRFVRARAALEDPTRTTMVLVTRPEVTALREAARTSAELRELGLVGQRLIVNGVFEASSPDDAVAVALARRGREALAQLPEALRGLPRTDVPLRGWDMLGLDTLRRVVDGTLPSSAVVAAAPSLPELPHLGSLVDALASARTGLVMVMGKGGVGKTTIAAAIAVELASRGIDVHLSTTDPAAHVAAALDGALPHLTVSRIDPAVETQRYIDHVLATKGKDLDADGRALMLEDLRSPCTEEVAVFHAFSRIVAEARGRVVVLDTAPTGHTLLLLDATGAYHRDVMRGIDEAESVRVKTPLTRLRDPAYTHIVLVTLAETTPVSEAARLQDDLRRAKIEPWAWVVNATLVGSGTTDPLLRQRVAGELRQIARVKDGLAARLAVVPWRAEVPRGVEGLRALIG